MLTQTAQATVRTRPYCVHLRKTFECPTSGRVTDYTSVDISVMEGYIPGRGGEIARLEECIKVDYPDWEITGLYLIEEPAVEF